MPYHLDQGRPVLPSAVHHLPDLLDMAPEAVLEAFRASQIRDFEGVVSALETAESPLHGLFTELRGLAGADNGLQRLPMFGPGGMRALFLDLHDHVMAHPVWRHPFFLRFFAGDFTRPQLVMFAKNYFNQIKNTRQCVALATGRFHGLMGLPYGGASERVSEFTQIILAQLVTDEYGVGAQELEGYPTLEGLLRARTHIGIYRQLFEGIGVPFAEQDVPMVPGVADNVLIQRMVSSNPAFTPLEALASVGLGMEWGVPEFFSFLLGGVIRFAWKNDIALTRDHLEVFTGHVKLDVMHAVSVMAVTALYIKDDADILAAKQAVNALMAGRHGMMTDLYHRVFGEPCPSLAEVGLEPRHHLRDRRYAEELLRARRTAAPEAVVDHAAWIASTETPLVFA